MAPLAAYHRQPQQQQQYQSSSSHRHKRKNRMDGHYNSNYHPPLGSNHKNNYYGPPTLSWRLDPDESLSDWILTVVAIQQPPHPRTTTASSSSLAASSRLKSSNRSVVIDDSKSFTTATAAHSSSSSSYSSTTTTTTGHSKKYFVHRTQLGVGPRRSEYFAKLFQSRQLQHGSTTATTTTSSSSSATPVIGKTRIELHPLAAEAFPIMLDFIYSPVGTPLPEGVTTETAVPLRQLASSLGIRELFDAVTDFIQQDLASNPTTTAITYIIHADVFQQDKLVQVAMSIAAQCFEQVKFSQLAQLSPSLFERLVVDNDVVQYCCSSEVLSARVAAYCRCRPGCVDAAMLQRMTDARLMPRIAPEESIFYLRLLDEIISDDSTVDFGNNNNNNNSSSNGGASGSSRGKSFIQTSDLYKRCVATCHETIRNALIAERNALLAQQQQQQVPQESQQPQQQEASNSKKEGKTSETRQTRTTMLDYQKLPDWMKVDILESSLLQCPSPDDIRALQTAKMQSQERHASEAAVQVAYLNVELDKLRHSYEKKVASYQAMLEAQEQELRAYLMELSKFVRVPNHYRVTPLVSEYTYQAQQEHNEYGEPMYGEIPPDDLPRFVPPQEDGWVLHEEIATNHHNHHHHPARIGNKEHATWPMYYYKGDFHK